MNRLILFVFLMAITFSCKKNSLPVIYSLEASRDTVLVGDTVKLTCTFSDPDSDMIKFEWTCIHPNTTVIASTNNPVSWIAPTIAGSYLIMCTITDGEEKVADSVRILVRNVVGTFTDIRDQQLYQWVKIGSKTWMAENLRYLPAVAGPLQGSGKEKRYYVYRYSGSSVESALKTPGYLIYGALYNWVAAVDGDTVKYFSKIRLRGVCPDGWHLPDRGEVGALFIDIGPGTSHHAKSIQGWEDNGNGDNLSGLNILPAGYRYENSGFINRGFVSSFWSVPLHNTTAVWSFQFHYSSDIQDSDTWGSNSGLSVRCVKDD